MNRPRPTVLETYEQTNLEKSLGMWYKGQ
jgi:hypothetical protein